MNQVLILGKPNSGKSLLFNRLTGANQKVANFPGVTVEVKRGVSGSTMYVDFPGVYSLQALTTDEIVAIQQLKKAVADKDISVVLCNLDATRLERSLVLGVQVKQLADRHGLPVVFSLNMMDEISGSGLKLDVEGLSKDLKSRVIAISAKTKMGLSELKQALDAEATSGKRQLEAPIGEANDQVDFESNSGSLLRAKELAKKYGPNSSVILKNQNRIDHWVLSDIWGGAIFLVTMLVLFQSIFSWASPLMDGVESAIGNIGSLLTPLLPEGIASDFVNDAILGGFGSFLVFVPQIFILTFIIGLLEDSGYMARAAIICHKPLSLVGLSGKSFVSLLSGHACAIPAMFAARIIESPKKRILTIMALPLVACSARLPVYSLLIVALIPSVTFAGGLVGLQGLAFFALFVFGYLVAGIVTGILSKTVYKEESDAPFLLELPPYRLPAVGPLAQRSIKSSWAFVKEAGAIIFAVTIVVWVLGYFPNGGEDLGSSWLASVGQFIGPIFEPIGLDWKFGVAVLASFLAREVFVGTLGTLYGIEGADENIAGLASNLEASGLTMGSGVALLVFYAIALQCVSTVAVMKKETGSGVLPIVTFVAYSVLAYILALAVYQLF